MPTIPDVFIIESLYPDDEGNGRFEGVMLSSILRLHGKNPKYRYVRTRKQFKKAVKQFGKSNYRYLHISAHANKTSMCTTNGDDIGFSELADILNPHLSRRRLFLSACKMVQEELAKKIIPPSGCLSVAGPTENIKFSDAAIVWASIYHLMFTNSKEKMTGVCLKKRLANVRALFEVKLAYYAKSTNHKGYSRKLFAK